MNQTKILPYIALFSSVLFLSACGGNGGVLDITSNKGTEIKEKPVVGDGGVVLEANQNMPKAGEFLSPSFEEGYDQQYSPIVYFTSSGDLRHDIIEKGTGRGKRFMALRRVTYNTEGKLDSISMGTYLDIPVPTFKHTLGDKLKHVTTYDEAGGRSLYDAGLKAGGQYAGVYAADDVPFSYFWRDPAVAGWNYQTYGMFDSGSRFGIDETNVYQSVGEYTKAIPTGGEATYNGISSGSGRTNGVNYSTTADVTVKVDFSERNVDFKTTNTKKYNFDGAAKLQDGVDTPDLNLTGNFKLEKGQAGFIGEIKTADDALSGQVKALFYGPNADEVGGVFGVKKDGTTDHYVGGFGARRK